MKPKIRSEDEHEAWYIYLVFLEAHLSKCERNVREYENPDRGLMYSKAFYRAQVMAATAARDAVEKEVRKWQEGRIDSAAGDATVDSPSFTKGGVSG